MDLWKWVVDAAVQARKDGRPRLAELIHGFSSYVTDLQHERVDAVFPEALALARQARSPWLEVFFRHWNLQSRVFRRLGTSDVLKEAVSLLEFAHRDEAKDCPQSVCVVQDVARCYANIDGPGYAAERIAVADEALARLTPRVSCFVCISEERGQALIDAGRPEEAVQYLLQQVELIKRVGGEPRGVALANGYMALGRFQEAEEEAVREWSEAVSVGQRRDGEVFLAWARAEQGRTDEALKILPRFEDIRDTPDLYLDYARALEALARREAVPNDVRLNANLAFMEERLLRIGAWRKTFDLALVRARLALARGRPRTALHALARMKAAFAELRQTQGPDEALAEVERLSSESLSRRPLPVLPAAPERVAATLPGDAEEDLEILEEALRRWPDDEQLACRAARALQALGQEDQAEALLQRQLAPKGDSLAVLQELFGLLFHAGRLDDARKVALDALDATGDASVRAPAHAMVAAVERKRRNFPAVVQHMRQHLELAPSLEAASMLAEAQRDGGDLAGSLATLDDAVARWPEPGNHDWERMVVGTLLSRWTEVRDSWRRLGNEASGEGPIFEPMGLIRLNLTEENGEVSEVLARRTGPVSAQVLSIAGAGKPQHADDEVVFDAARLDEPGPDDENPLPALFDAIAVTRPGRRVVFAIEGVHPGDEAVASLRKAVSAAGARMSVVSGAEYQLKTEEHGELRGLYARVAVPPENDLHRVAEALARATEGWPHPLLWPQLLTRLGDGSAAEQQVALAERYGISLDE